MGHRCQQSMNCPIKRLNFDGVKLERICFQLPSNDEALPLFLEIWGSSLCLRWTTSSVFYKWTLTPPQYREEQI